MSLPHVPHLSLLSFVEGSSKDKVDFIDNIMMGLKEFGFIVLKDHIVDQKKIDFAYDYVNEFFSLDIQTKKKYYDENLAGQRGYTPFKVEHAKDSQFGDLKEFWHVGRELNSTSEYYNSYPKNIWPSEVKEFKKTMIELYDAMDATSVVLLEAIGRGLDLPENYFKDMVSDGNSILRLIHYPPTKGEDVKNSIRAGAHEDINLITLLVGATASGLQLLDRNGNWLDIKSSPGEIVVDTGDMMSRITNDILPSTTHRVTNPENSDGARFSMPFFVHPHANANLSCINSCVGAGAKYPDILANDFLMERLQEIGLT